MYMFTTDKDRYILNVGIVPGENDRFKVNIELNDFDPNDPENFQMETEEFPYSIDLSNFDFSGHRIRAYKFIGSEIVFDSDRLAEIEAREEEARLKEIKEAEELAKIPSNSDLALYVSELEDCILEMSEQVYT